MATSEKPYLSHIDRTSTWPRDPTLYTLTLTRIDQVNPRIRLIRLDLNDKQRGMVFRPGQWLDTYTPTPKPGGFTIVSAPSFALPLTKPSDPNHPRREESGVEDSTRRRQDTSAAARDRTGILQHDPYIELAIQDSPSNPPAAWFWQPAEAISGKEVDVRVGGSFVYPPAHRRAEGEVKNLVLVAGGVGINPFMSMLSQMQGEGVWPERVTVLYATRIPESGVGDVLFWGRLRTLRERMELKVFAGRSVSVGGGDGGYEGGDGDAGDIVRRRMRVEDVWECCRGGGNSDGDGTGNTDEKVQDGTVVYICGPKSMTDEFMDGVPALRGMHAEDVMCEKWW